MSRLLYGILMFLASCCFLMSNLYADEDEISSQEHNLVKRHAEPRQEDEELFYDVLAEEPNGKDSQIFNVFWGI